VLSAGSPDQDTVKTNMNRRQIVILILYIIWEGYFEKEYFLFLNTLKNKKRRLAATKHIIQVIQTEIKDVRYKRPANKPIRIILKNAIKEFVPFFCISRICVKGSSIFCIKSENNISKTIPKPPSRI
jgi:histone acetyltransferase (RNA polymerase elongator complex component)